MPSWGSCNRCTCMTVWFRTNNLLDMAMHVAVSTLSPVSIQMRMPACLKDSSVVLTSSCNLSSTPVNPSNSKSDSKYLRYHILHRPLSVLHPKLSLMEGGIEGFIVFLAQLFPPYHQCPQTFPCHITALLIQPVISLNNLCHDSISALLIKCDDLVERSLTMMPMLLLSEVNGKQCRISNWS